MNTSINDTILVCEEAGQAVVRFCTAQEAKQTAEHAMSTGAAPVTYITIDGVKAELLVTVTNLGERVQSAKQYLQEHIRLREVLDKHGIPNDPALRSKIHVAFRDYTRDSLRQALAR
ncbi:hypothetical protein RQP54_17940 [Curvibacter sp. APW13]|uniref:hypothetical protein n=1 Tax=Curvibacter sp. APW13 TaxID=3077236 RepID=UPI0028DEF98C|nr:hypothetical protein [Curvibacter sp. APW13]MDT8992759.1 hypothetical protein [Curvibacter sp. APW13]